MKFKKKPVSTRGKPAAKPTNSAQSNLPPSPRQVIERLWAVCDQLPDLLPALSSEDLSYLLICLEFSDKIRARSREHAKERLAAGDSVQGWVLSRSSAREIVNTAIWRDVSDALSAYPMPVLEGAISQRVIFAESAAQGRTVFEPHPAGWLPAKFPPVSEVMELINAKKDHRNARRPAAEKKGRSGSGDKRRIAPAPR